MITNFYGKNICFYYYGEDHLVINLYKYIKKSIENNNFVYMYINNETFNMVYNNLTNNEKQMIGLITIKDFTPMDNKTIEILKDKALKQGFFGIAMIIDAAKVIRETTPLVFEKTVKSEKRVCEKYRVNIMTCYDFIDYVGRGRYINDDVMKMSYLYHGYRLFGNDIVPVENFILSD